MNELPFCLYPWYHQLIKTDGSASPCCAFNDSFLPTINYKDYFNSDWNKSLQEIMLSDNIHDGCKLCYETEQSGGFSNRHESFSDFYLFNNIDIESEFIEKNKKVILKNIISSPKILSQEVDLSNICNLKCRMCDSSRSSKWIQDEKALNRYTHRLRESNWELQNPESIKLLRFLGGEPFMHQPLIITELRKVESLGRLKELSLHFNSNMTQTIDNELFDIFKQCKSVSINASLDGFGNLNDYIRSESEWSTIVNNIKILDDFTEKHIKNFYWMPINTVTVYNANKLDELYGWLLSRWPKHGIPTPAVLAVEPKEMSIVNLPDKVKEKLTDRYHNFSKKNRMEKHWNALASYLEFDRTLSEEEFLEQFWHTTNILDARRNTKFSDVNPEMAEWLKI